MCEVLLVRGSAPQLPSPTFSHNFVITPSMRNPLVQRGMAYGY